MCTEYAQWVVWLPRKCSGNTSSVDKIWTTLVLVSKVSLGPALSLYSQLGDKRETSTSYNKEYLHTELVHFMII